MKQAVSLNKTRHQARTLSKFRAYLAEFSRSDAGQTDRRQTDATSLTNYIITDTTDTLNHSW